jgi:hypothetical protein
MFPSNCGTSRNTALDYERRCRVALKSGVAAFVATVTLSTTALAAPIACTGPVTIFCPGPTTTTGTPSVQPQAQVQPQLSAPAPAGVADVGIGALSKWIEDGVGWELKQLQPFLGGGGMGGDWFAPIFGRMVNIASALMLPFLLLGLIQALLRRDVILAIKVAFLYPLVGVASTACAIWLTQELMAITDGMTAYMLQGLGDNLAALLTHLAATIVAVAAGAALSGAGSAVAVAAALVVGGATLLIILELLLRQAAIYICLLFLPLAFSVMLWPRLQHLAVKIMEALVAIILLKFVVATILALGATAYSASPFSVGAGADPGFVAIVIGAVVLSIGALSPLALARIVPLTEAYVQEAWSSHARGVGFAPIAEGGRQLHRVTLDRITQSQTAELAGVAAGPAGLATVLLSQQRGVGRSPGTAAAVGRSAQSADVMSARGVGAPTPGGPAGGPAGSPPERPPTGSDRPRGAEPPQDP